MATLARLDGRPATVEQLRALALLNYGHFTSMRVEAGGVRGLGLHLRRLAGDCRELFAVELDLDRVRWQLRAAVAGLEAPVVARVTVFDPGLDITGLVADAEPKVLVTLRPAPSEPPGPLVLASTVYQRELPRVKHVGLFGAVRLRRAARRAGADDVLFTDTAGRVCETAVANIGFVDGDRVVWPRGEWLPGVTMRLLGGGTGSETVTLEQLASLDGAFVTNAALGVVPVAAVDAVRWRGARAAIAGLRQRYAELRCEPLR